LTTNTEIPYVNLEADGTQTSFTFNFSTVEEVDIYVLVDAILHINGISYTIENLTDEGGEIVFRNAPDSGAMVLILRRTTTSQNVDYGDYASFPAETHEWNLDKITYILQELVNGVIIGEDGEGNPIVLTFDLESIEGESYVRITNSGGTDATIPRWTSGNAAGVFHGEIGAAPADGSATQKEDGYVWIEV